MWFGVWATLVLIFVLTLLACGFVLWRKGLRTMKAATKAGETLGSAFANTGREQEVRAALSVPRDVDVFGGTERKLELKELRVANKYERSFRQQIRHELAYARWRTFNR